MRRTGLPAIHDTSESKDLKLDIVAELSYMIFGRLGGDSTPQIKSKIQNDILEFGVKRTPEPKSIFAGEGASGFGTRKTRKRINLMLYDAEEAPCAIFSSFARATRRARRLGLARAVWPDGNDA